MKTYAKNDSMFPSHNTFHSRFTSKSEMIEHLRKWLIGVDRYDDVGKCFRYLTTFQRSTPKVKSDGFVCLLRSGAYYKIGKSDEIERRIKQIRIALPEATSLEHAIQTDDPSGIEAYWHRRFADRRLNGEWFKLSAADVLAFRRRKFQ